MSNSITLEERGESFQPRPITSFVRREGRMTPAQKKALEHLWPRYGIDLGTGPLNLAAIFNRQAERILEIGFGNGESLLQQARAAPERDFLGIEVYRPGIGHLLLRLKAEGLENIRVIHGDAWEVLQRALPNPSLDGVQIFFPDPWPKKRHHKRRLIQPSFVDLLERKIKPGGWFHLATDWQDYAEQIKAVLSQHAGFNQLTNEGQSTQRPRTKFEARGQQQGHGVWDLRFKRSVDS
ncbi:tRNA (guanosine(46)-N7)-methyltransferase TrmB [Nitrosococcus oceani]|uniref:tRNA (guanine-N(7)-)-methyltransferase n=2 Tax=Nitrosococcus oceani TaxID=1229 RepID=TRMB_NITOC|nr:tRNA (guanosine(46)-N7)-methyltransferase TrmB [Nitrosococcus oceani]Q3JCB2.1 RecName: Full=tRNA (guanine-N(7)-)-methyltransferase; AltName: Full=tRNA (guanine(46)-N(7))-methyltransferase; AltName: Full=tRNA(m7G46)-methyltransferase [Nitrosococcus oceani ATCC 19707]KFI20034.1 tRNA (guanine-N7)-methyltransferase [Nitrosococcus oceani C-27]ABA57534.1 tRNA (guanine-N(7)-)-methyltransferase [Nitrosococcus oceani ATCC 19707]EDZ67466.1 tRNA (guanine-N(7)-)-methyltransferase [Nitrosococcus oceani A